jgi:hypothetical protein
MLTTSGAMSKYSIWLNFRSCRSNNINIVRKINEEKKSRRKVTLAAMASDELPRWMPPIY